MNIFILTGAGISADSGLKTFRDEENGIWMGEDLIDVCLKGCFEENPTLVSGFYDMLRSEVDAHAPNAAHFAISEYIEKTKNNVMLVTQNVDNYHELSGSNNVIKMHGDLYTLYCVKCDEKFHVGSGYVTEKICKKCQSENTIRPDVVFFEEDVKYDQRDMSNFLKGKYEFETLSYFIAIGTSGMVYPAALLSEMAHFNSKKVYINLTDEHASHIFSEKRIGKAVDVVPEYFKQLYEQHG